MYVIVFLQGLVFYGAVSTVYRQAKGLSMTDIFVIESVSSDFTDSARDSLGLVCRQVRL